jgi:hypothetical protein
MASAGAALWIMSPPIRRQKYASAIRRFLPAVFFGAVFTVALLAFAFISNGKVI